MKDLCYLSASELSKGISTGDILSEDLVKSYIGRIKKFDKTIKAWAHFDAQYILDKAVEADDYRKLGRPIGPLHGLPIAIKDIFGTNDMPTGYLWIKSNSLLKVGSPLKGCNQVLKL